MKTDSTRLRLEAVNSFYGQSHVLFDVSLEVDAGEIVYLLGRNGAGKTTTMKTAAGLLGPWTGGITLADRSIAGEPPHRIARRGLGYVPQDRRIFTYLTVGENLELARKPGPGGEVVWNLSQVFEFFPVLEQYLGRKAGLISGGEQQMLAIARALMGNPRILLLDEPMEGLAPLVVRSLEEQIRRLRASGVGLLISETNLRSATRVGDRAYVLERGTVVLHDSLANIAAAPEWVEKYLAVV